MSGLEILGAVSSIAGLTDQVFRLWRSINDTKSFGSDLLDALGEINVEYYRFVTWCHAVGVRTQEISSSRQSRQANLQGAPPANPDLFPIFKVVETSISAIEKILRDVEAIGAKYAAQHRGKEKDLDTVPKSSTSEASRVVPLLGVDAEDFVQKAIDNRKESEERAQKRTSLLQRWTWAHKPWKSPDKDVLKEKSNRFCYYNNTLYSLLPQRIRDSIAEDAILPIFFREDRLDAEKFMILEDTSNDRNQRLRNSTNLWLQIKGLEEIEGAGALRNQADGSDLKLKSKEFSPDTAQQGGSRFQIGTLAKSNDAPIRAVIEWYRVQGQSLEARQKASERIIKLTNLCQVGHKPEGMSILDSEGYLEDDDRFGLISKMPESADKMKPPRTLHHFITHRDSDGSMPRPPLEDRIQLALALSKSVFLFHVVRWFHKNINSFNVVFFQSGDKSEASLGIPFVTGFDVSRPSASIELTDTPGQGVYLHPELRVTGNESRPGYQHKYDIYSLGLVLLEIGLWATVEELVDVSLPPQEFTDEVIELCQAIPFHMGSRYRDIVLKCLKGSEDVVSLEGSYWNIVKPLMELGI